jgi:hypothetical protein
MRTMTGAVVVCTAGLATAAMGDTWNRIGASAGVGAPAGGAEAFPFSDSFDSYAPGAFPCIGGGCSGPNGWSIWYSGGTAGQIVSGAAHSGTNYLQLAAGSDIVQTGNLTSGQWVLRAYSFIPTGDTGQSYFIVMNAYGSTAVDTWSIEIQFNGSTGSILDDTSGVCPHPAPPVIGTIVRDQWVEVRAEINLDANTYSLFYNGQAIRTNITYTSQGTCSPVLTPAIACLDLYSFTSNGARWDSISLQAAGGTGCYANCDASTAAPVLNVADFTCFLQKFSAGDTYANCDASTASPVLNVADFTCFLQKFSAGCP